MCKNIFYTRGIHYVSASSGRRPHKLKSAFYAFYLKSGCHDDDLTQHFERDEIEMLFQQHRK